MDKVLFTAMTGGKTVLKQMDAVSQNLANGSSVAYKAVEQQVKSYDVPGDNPKTRVMAVEMSPEINLSGGAIEPTGRPLDVAFSGDGWFTIATSQGNQYTRNGHFSVTNGVLTNSKGENVLSEDGQALQVNGNSVINGKGQILTPDEKGVLQLSGTLKMSFLDNSSLTRTDSGNFISSKPEVLADTAQLVGGSLESSNANPVQSMVEIIELSRRFDLNMKMIKTADENDRAASKLLA